MNTRRSRVALLLATLLFASGLSGCGSDEDSSKPQSAAAVTDPTVDPPSQAEAETPNPSTQPTTPNQTAPQQPPVLAEVIGAATVQWSAPQQKTDGSVLQNLAGFTIVYGTSANNLDKTIRVNNPSIDQYVVEQLPAGTYYFGVKAHDSAGAESELSNLMSKVIG